MKKFEFENKTFYTNGEEGKSGLVFVSKFVRNKMRWNKGFKRENINQNYLKSL